MSLRPLPQGPCPAPVQRAVCLKGSCPTLSPSPGAALSTCFRLARLTSVAHGARVCSESGWPTFLQSSNPSARARVAGCSRGALMAGRSQGALVGGHSQVGTHRGHSRVGAHGWVLMGDTHGWVLVGRSSWVGTHGWPKALDRGGQTVMQTQVWDDGCRKNSSGPHGVF